MKTKILTLLLKLKFWVQDLLWLAWYTGEALALLPIAALLFIMKRMKLITIIGALVLSSCSGQYWESTKRTSTGKYTYYGAAWGSSGTCNTYKTLPIKRTNYNRYAYPTKHR